MPFQLRKKSLFFLIFIFIFAFPFFQKPVFAANYYWMNNATLDGHNKDLKETIEAANEGKTIIYSGPVEESRNRDVMWGFLHDLAGPLSDDPEIVKIYRPENSALGTVSLAMTSFYDNPPASLAWYVRDTLANAGFAKPAYAQGIGFTGLLPLLPVWKATRNVAYVVLIFVMVAIGFMVIFRMKIDPKTVISIQAALPKIVVALVIITLSYAIVGLFIDLMYLLIAMVVSILGSGFNYTQEEIANAQRIYMTGQMGALMGHIFTAASASGARLYQILMGGEGGVIGAEGLLKILARGLITKTTAPWITVAPALIILLIVALGILFTFIRLVLILLNAYIQILINLILGPIILLGEAIPGKSTFGGWIMNLLANLIVFPTTAAILMLSHYIGTLYQIKPFDQNPIPLWYPPLTMPGGNGTYFTGFLGLGIILMAPNLVVSVKKMFGAKSAIPMTAATLLSPLTGSAQTAMGAASQFYYLKQMPGLGKLMGNKPGHPS
jgi:hypothetical protein